MRRRLDAAGYDEVKTPQLMDARQWEQSGHWGKYRENMFVVPDEIPNDRGRGAGAVGQGRPDGAQADELPGARPDLPPGHQVAIATCRSAWPSSAAATATSRTARCTASCACASSPRTTRISSAARTRSIEEVRGVLRPARPRLPRSRLRELCDQARAAPRQALRHRRDVGQGRADAARRGRRLRAATTDEFGWEELPGEGAFYAPKLEFHLTDAIGRTWQVRHDPGRHRAARAARRDLCRRGRRAAPPGDAPPRDPRHVRALHRHPDRASCRPLPALARAGAGGGRDDRVRRRRLCAARSPRSCAAAGIRVETDLRNEKINYKVREHSLAKVPHLLVVGKREAEEGTVALRPLGADARQEVLTLDEAIARLVAEATPPDLRA